MSNKPSPWLSEHSSAPSDSDSPLPEIDCHLPKDAVESLPASPQAAVSPILRIELIDGKPILTLTNLTFKDHSMWGTVLAGIAHTVALAYLDFDLREASSNPRPTGKTLAEIQVTFGRALLELNVKHDLGREDTRK